MRTCAHAHTGKSTDTYRNLEKTHRATCRSTETPSGDTGTQRRHTDTIEEAYGETHRDTGTDKYTSAHVTYNFISYYIPHTVAYTTHTIQHIAPRTISTDPYTHIHTNTRRKTQRC